MLKIEKDSVCSIYDTHMFNINILYCNFHILIELFRSVRVETAILEGYHGIVFLDPFPLLIY